jgi:hypothetical protein
MNRVDVRKLQKAASRERAEANCGDRLERAILADRPVVAKTPAPQADVEK